VALKAIWRRLTPLDRLVVLLLLLASFASFAFLGQRPKGRQVIVEQAGRIVFTAPLGADRTVVLPGPHGETVLAIHHGRAYIATASCPNKICMGMGEVSRQGELLACVPNGLLLRVEGDSGDEVRDYDLLSR
jgi:hypothetical protein